MHFCHILPPIINCRVKNEIKYKDHRVDILDNLIKWIKWFFVEPRGTLMLILEFYSLSVFLGYSGMFLNIPISIETPPVRGVPLSPPLECPADLKHNEESSKGHLHN